MPTQTPRGKSWDEGDCGTFGAPQRDEKKNDTSSIGLGQERKISLFPSNFNRSRRGHGSSLLPRLDLRDESSVAGPPSIAPGLTTPTCIRWRSVQEQIPAETYCISNRSHLGYLASVLVGTLLHPRLVRVYHGRQSHQIIGAILFPSNPYSHQEYADCIGHA